MVSILIPFKNTQNFLSACLESILNQTFTNWEVVAVDDHSTDQSREIAFSYSKKNDRIKVYKNTGEGIIPALRTAYSNATGSFITRMDSDDIMLPNRLEVMVTSLEHAGIGHIAVGQVRYFSEQGISNGYARYQNWLNALTARGINYSEIYKECVIPSPCWMVHQQDFAYCGGFLPDRYPEDYDLTFRFYEKQLQIIPCNEVLHLWRDYPERTSRNHQHYAQNYFLEIKLYYFLRLDFDPQRPLAIWGAGFKGKTLAKRLVAQDIDFYWLCDNPRKINKKIYGKNLLHFSALKELEHPQSIITVANTKSQHEIRKFLERYRQTAMHDYFFFC
ncbi:MAG: glycosyltransferase [Bacteroidota bacterium]